MFGPMNHKARTETRKQGGTLAGGLVPADSGRHPQVPCIPRATKADVVVEVRWIVPVTVRRPEVPGIVVPRTAPQFWFRSPYTE